MTGARTWRRLMAAHAGAICLVLVIAGQVLPPPAISDSAMMEYVGQGVINPGCTNLNCWRILAAAVVERFPGPSLPRWRTYAAIGNAGGAAVTGELALAFGLSPQAALLSMWMSGMSVGSFTTVYHPYTSDSMIFFLAPLIALLLIRGRRLAAFLISAVGIFAKEFAAVPLFMNAVADGIRGEWAAFRRGLAMSLAVIVLWVGYQIGMMVFFHYAYDANPSIDIMRGGYFWYWYQHIGLVTALLTVFSAFGAAYVLAAAGFTRAPERLRALVGGAVIPALAFMYVETPDRALFNFHFLVGPLAAIALVSAPVLAGWTFVAAYTIANLRIGSTWDVLPPSRYALACCLAIACLAIAQMWGRSPANMVTAGPGIPNGLRRG